jgi:hypothetical protein
VTSARAFYDRLIAASAAGAFPAVELDGVSGVCRYRTKSGRACPAGLLIPPERYEPAYEGRLAFTLFSGPCRDLVPAGLTPRTVWRVQYAHDVQVARIGTGAQDRWDHAAFVAALSRIAPFDTYARREPCPTPFCPFA